MLSWSCFTLDLSKSFSRAENMYVGLLYLATCLVLAKSLKHNGVSLIVDLLGFVLRQSDGYLLGFVLSV